MSTPKDPTLSTKADCEEPRAADKTWCKKHLAEYQRTYLDNKEGRAEARGFQRGVSAMRDFIVGELYKMGASAQAELVRGARGPRLD